MFLNQLGKIPNILVVGDLMLDRYWFGAVDRISPEAPVPVLSADRTDVRAGGAANVAMNLAELGANTNLLSVIGDDDAGRTATDLLGAIFYLQLKLLRRLRSLRIFLPEIPGPVAPLLIVVVGRVTDLAAVAGAPGVRA